MHALLRASGVIDRMNERIGRSVAWLGLAAVIVCTGNAVARYALNIGSNAWLELQWYFNSAVFLLIAAYALRRNEHVRIDVINGRLSPRTQAWIDILGGLFMLLPTVIIIGCDRFKACGRTLNTKQQTDKDGCQARHSTGCSVTLSAR